MNNRQIKDKIKNIVNDKNLDFNTVLRLFMYERFIERLSVSDYRDNFILKGGFYLSTLFGLENRSTADIDTAFINSDFQYLRDCVKWNKLDDNQVDRALKNSMVNVSIKMDGRVVGVGRIVGDYVLKGMLTDIMVDPLYQGIGIGKLIVTSLIDKLTDMVGVGESFQLEASPTANNREFYIKCGLKYKPENQDGVYMWIRK